MPIIYCHIECFVFYSARHFGRAIVMPNLRPPITTTTAAVAYRERILKSLSTDIDFNPLMTLYLTDNMKSEEIKLASKLMKLQLIIWSQTLL